MGTGPGPLEVVAAQPAGHVDHLANEVQPGLFGFHGLGRHIARVYPAQRDLGFFVALTARGGQAPIGQGFGQFGQGFVGHLGGGALQGRVLADPGFGQATGHQTGQFVAQQFFGAQFGFLQALGQVHLGGQVQANRCAFLPVAGDLQHAGT